MMRRATFAIGAPVALSGAVYGQCQPGQAGQTPLLAAGVATQGHIEQQAQGVFGFCANPGDAVLIRLLSLSNDSSLRLLTVSWQNSTGFTNNPQPINPRPRYSVPNATPGYPPISTPG